jgi:hypothetical protein
MKAYSPSKSVRAWRGSAFLVVLIVCVSYASQQRHWSDYLLYSYIIGLPLGAGFMWSEGRMYWEDLPPGPKRKVQLAKLLIPVPLVALFLIPFGAGLYSIFVSILDAFLWGAFKLSAQGRSAMFAVGASALTGGALFVFRLRVRSLYGMSEVIVGLTVAGHRVGFDASAGEGGNAPLFLAVLTAGVYLVVRGLDNLHQAWVAKDDPAINWLLDLKTRIVARLPRDPPPSRSREELLRGFKFADGEKERLWEIMEKLPQGTAEYDEVLHQWMQAADAAYESAAQLRRWLEYPDLPVSGSKSDSPDS